MIYCYICENCGKNESRNVPVSERNEPGPCECGHAMRRDYTSEHGRFRSHPGNWPMESDAAGVNPEQIPEATAYAEKMGVPTRYNPETGAAIFTSREHRAKFCKISGLYDRNGGYGDAAPRHNMRKRRTRCRK